MKNGNVQDAEVQYLQAYESALALWPAAVSSYFVKTSQGQTHILESGSEGAPPLILLHGASMSSTMWYPNVLEWSREYRVICLDIPGDKNKSILQTEFSDRASYAEWLKEVLDKLDIPRADIVGLSYGALHTINFLTFAPERINRAVLMSPAATYVPFHPEFYSHAFGMVNNREGVKQFFEWIFKDRYIIHPYIYEQLAAGMMWIDPRKSTAPKENGFPYVFTDEELAVINTPILLLLGDKEVMYDHMAAFERADASSPKITVEIVKDAGHLMSMENPEYINKRVLTYLSSF